MAFTEYCARSGGSNLNAGTLDGSSTEPGTSAAFTAVGDSDGTSVFTPSDGSTPASTVSVGQFGSVYVTAGATVATFIGRITAVAAGVNGAVTFSTTAKSGTFPSASAGAHTITLKVGGAWAGPAGAVAFPIGFIAGTGTDVAGDGVRVNVKNDQTYAITAGMSAASTGPVVHQGYTSAYGDLGKAVVDGGTSGTSYTLLSAPGSPENVFADFELKNNGATGSANAVSFSTAKNLLLRCVVHDVRGIGIILGTSSLAVECETYNCNQSNTASLAGFSGSLFVRCIAHDNSGSNTSGFVAGSAGYCLFDSCIADSNGANGFTAGSTGTLTLKNCDAYNNVGSGALSASVPIYAENSNFILNGAYGVSVAALNYGMLLNCGFGAGTKANVSGAVNTTGVPIQVGTVTYAADVTPWVDPANGDFRVNLAAAKGAGRGSFTETAASYAGTIAYPSIGAAQNLIAVAVLSAAAWWFMMFDRS